MQRSYLCPHCGYQVVFGIRFCGNCGTFLAWPTQQSNRGHFTFISLIVVAGFVGVLIVGGIIAYDSSLPAPVSSTVPRSVSQSQPQPQPQPPSLPQALPLATPILLSPGLNTDPGQAIDTLTPSLQWNAVSGADYYSLIISRFPYSSGNTICTPPQLQGTSLTIPSGVLEYGQRYRWAIEAHTNTSASSVSNALYFQTAQPPVSPLSNSTPPTVPATSQQTPTQTSPPISVPPWAPVNLPGWSP